MLCGSRGETAPHAGLPMLFPGQLAIKIFTKQTKKLQNFGAPKTSCEFYEKCTCAPFDCPSSNLLVFPNT